jgi:uncharacterized repeat protein (TIGR03803 family)
MLKLSLRLICLVCVFTALAAIGLPADTFTTLATFQGFNGSNPYYGTLAQGFDGKFYGTTSSDGLNHSGTIFKITTTGKVKRLYSFCSQTGCIDGAVPYAGLVLAKNGNFYGTTRGGGANDQGTVFKITPAGALTTLYSFCAQANCTDGADPVSALVRGSDGNFYGTTLIGGAYYTGVDSNGTIFKITPAGKLTTLYSFCSSQPPDCVGGGEPVAGLVQGTDGNFYGVTKYGGPSWEEVSFGAGTIFKMTPDGTLTTLYNFCVQFPCVDGGYPLGTLVQATDGNFYGTTSIGGLGNHGTIFEMTPAGQLTTLYSFCTQSVCTDGSEPYSGLVQATDGNFYGTTENGGAYDDGVIFEITAHGQFTTLYSFCSEPECTDGFNPYAGLLQATNGTFYGTTYGSPAGDHGTVFSLATGLGPFVETFPTSGAVGAVVKILGNSLTGTTSVTFNGTLASFTVVGSTEIKTTVPSGATTGSIIVTTPSGSLTSNVIFRVT